MTKRILSVLLVLSILFPAFTRPAKADSAQPYFFDPYNQLPAPNVEHYSFWKTYLYSMFTNDPWLDKPLKWAISDNALSAATNGAASGWNAIRPSGVEAMVAAPSVATADILINYSPCPGLPADSYAGCWRSNNWTLLSTLEVNAWTKSSIYIRPTPYVMSTGAYTVTYSAATMQGVIAHELGHALGLNEQYILWNTPICNSAVTSAMDGSYVAGTGTARTLTMCDVGPTAGFDKGAWNSYQNGGRYLPDIALVYGDGRVRTAWYDNAWSDYEMYLRWEKGNSSSGPWFQFAQTYHIGKNGSHYSVPGADTSYWRVEGSIYPTYYGVNSKYIRVCSKPIFNYVYTTPATEERCMPIFWFQNPL